MKITSFMKIFPHKAYVHMRIFFNNHIGNHFWKKPCVRTIDETIEFIIANHCSVSRFGDGEFAVMLGTGYNSYQDHNMGLESALKEVLQEPIANHIVCLPDIFGNLGQLRKESI